MGRYDQAPKLVNKKPKLDGNIIMFTNEMHCNIMKQIGSKYRAGHVLIWLIGQADGFGIAEKTAANAIGISTSAYHQDIRFLDDLGLITHVSGKSITINYDKILGDQFEQSKNRVSNLDSLNQSEDNKDRVIKSDSLSEGVKINQSILSDQINQSILEKTKGDQFNQSMGDRFNHPMGVQIDQYNIEEHRKTYKGQNEKLGDQINQSILNNDFDYVQDAMDSFVKEQQKQQKKWVF